MKPAAAKPAKYHWITPRTLIIFVLAFLLTLIIQAPATLLNGWLKSASYGRLLLANANGTVWQGSGTLAMPKRAGGIITLGSLHWDMAALPLLGGKLKITLRWDDTPEATPTEVIASMNRIELNHLQAILPAAAIGEVSPLIEPVQLQGNLQIRSDHFVITPNGTEGTASADWLNAGSALSSVNPLGKYLLTFTGAGERLQIALTTTSGALLLEGQGNWSRPRGLEFNGKARAAEGQQERLAELLAHLGPQESPGVHMLTLTPQGMGR